MKNPPSAAINRGGGIVFHIRCLAASLDGANAVGLTGQHIDEDDLLGIW